MDTRLTFGEWLADQLRLQNLTQGRFAGAVGVSGTAVSSWVNNDKVPTRQSCRRIASVLGVPYEQVMAAAGHGAVESPGDAARHHAGEAPVPYDVVLPSTGRAPTFGRALSMAARNQDKLSPQTKAAMYAAIMVDLANEDWDESEFDDE